MIERVLKSVASRLGYELRNRATPPADMGEEFDRLYAECREFSKTSVERMYALYEACRYISVAKIPGAVVECGVWRGGSAMLAAGALRNRRETERDIWLYDTYEGMSEPTEHDLDKHGRPAAELMKAGEKNKETSVWCYASLDDVQRNMRATRYPDPRIRYIKGKVEDTIPNEIPEQIALLRLDTDFYESTLHELRHLYPRMAPGAVLIIDDYGHWQGARKATDQFFDEIKTPLLLQRIDYTGRMAVVGAR
jgi:hypothetical protein